MVVNLLIAVICDALQILRTAEEAVVIQQLYGQEIEASGKSEGGEEMDNIREGDDDGLRSIGSDGGMQRRVNDMQQMLDEMALAQEDMARTIKLLSHALKRKGKSNRSRRGILTDKENWMGRQ